MFFDGNEEQEGDFEGSSQVFHQNGSINGFLGITPARYAQKTVTFHFEFSSEVIENARYEMQTLNSWENL
jgi:hypothetical protein